MPSLMPWIVVFVVFDMVVTVLVIRHVLARRAAAGDAAREGNARGALPDLRRIAGFTEAIHPRLGEIVRAHWSGDPMSLPGVLGIALDEAAREARERGLELDRDTLKRLVEASLAKHRVAKGGALREALKQVA